MTATTPPTNARTAAGGKSKNKRERLEARITPEQKALFQRAAAVSGRSLTDFVVASVQQAAEEAIRTHDVIVLSARDSLLFAEALLNPPPPNQQLRAAAERYRELIGEPE